MTLISTYQDLVREIEIYRSRLEDLVRESYAINRMVEGNKIDLDLYIERKCKMDNEAAIIQAIIDDKIETEQSILNKLGQLEGLEYKVVYKRFIEGKTLTEIAEELGHEYSYIKNKSYEANKAIK